MTPLPSGPRTLTLGSAGLVAALAWRLRRENSGGLTIWPGVLRLAAGLTVWLIVAGVLPSVLDPTPGNRLAVPMALAWVAAVPAEGALEPVYRRFIRLLVPALAVVESLQVYPVAGSQVGIAGLIFVPVGAICVADGLRCLRAWSNSRGPLASHRLSITATMAAVAVVTGLSADLIARPAADAATAYRDQKALPFEGASLLRLPPESERTYARLVGLLRRHRCTTFVGYPDIDSLYLWSGIEAPPPIAPGAWIKALDAAKQRRVVQETRSSPRPCAIRSEARAELWLGHASPPDRPLVRYIGEAFVPVAHVGEFEFLLPKPGRT